MIDIVVYSNPSAKSAKKLAAAFGVRAMNGWDDNFYGMRDKRVFNYGCSAKTPCKTVINSVAAVECCIDKVSTFQVLRHAGVPVPNFVTNQHQVPKHWEQIVCRADARGCKNEGMQIISQGEAIPKAALYTEYFFHKKEYRVVVFKGKVVAIYSKEEDGEGGWDLIFRVNKGFEAINKACLDAAKALNIDYVGFDVVAKTKKDFVILEANTGPILTEEVQEFLVRKLKG